MTIVFIQERKRQKYLILVLALVIFAIILVVWWGFFRKGEGVPSAVLPVFIPPKVEIDWEILKDPQLQTLETFKEILPFEGEVGRKNPFIPY